VGVLAIDARRTLAALRDRIVAIRSAVGLIVGNSGLADVWRFSSGSRFRFGSSSGIGDVGIRR
jgi:hypothetical protein